MKHVSWRAFGLLAAAVLLTVAAQGAGWSTPKAHRATKTSSKHKASAPIRPIDFSKLTPVPIEDREGALDPFFQSLRDMGKASQRAPETRVVRILHFGDSHVEADLWTGEMRRLLQARFGDAGTGYVMPGRPWRYFRHSLARSTGTGWVTMGVGKDPGDGFVGLGGAALTPGPKARLAAVETSCGSYEVQLGLPDGHAIVHLYQDEECVFSGPVEEATAGRVGDVTLTFQPIPSSGAPCAALAFITGDTGTPGAPHQVAVEAESGDLRILGADFRSGNSGILYDALGLIGTEVDSLDRWRAEVRAALLQHAAPSLIIISYGTNDMGRSAFSEEEYHQLCSRLLADLRRDAPGVPVLVTGPIDRDGKRSRVKGIVRENEPEVIAALRQAAMENGCAFWDARAAMGGEGSIAKWKAAKLAQGDYVHLTEAGYVKLAGLLVDQLMAAYGRAVPADSKETPQPTEGSP